MTTEAKTALATQDRINTVLDRRLSTSKATLSPSQVRHYKQLIRRQLVEHNATIVAHYYTPEEIQQVAEATLGFVGDSLEMARFGSLSKAETLIVCGVKFMGETAKILSPQKRVLMPTLEATCSLDLGCPADQFKAFCAQHPDRTVVVYANTSAKVKALADWVVTSSIAVEVIDYLDSQGEKILWGPDRFLGDYVQKKTGADMVIWDSSCIVHEEFKQQRLHEMKAVYPNAAILAHPESPSGVVDMADAVGSTSQLIQAAGDLPQEQLIVATDQGIFYKMQQAVPDKELIIAPTAGAGATCRSCAQCPWMGMNDLELLVDVFTATNNEVNVDNKTALKAMSSLQRMLDFKNQRS